MPDPHPTTAAERGYKFDLVLELGGLSERDIRFAGSQGVGRLVDEEGLSRF